MSRLWEVDPETKAKLLQISRTNGNDRCCDCGAPSPQWASPKFGTFICLNCAGTHRGLGVHISFVRSITMDAFKTSEILRMENGGNDPWKTFYDDHPITQSEGRTFEDSTIKERYEGEVGEEWKERLAAKAEGRDYVPGQPKPKPAAQPAAASRSNTPLTNTGLRPGHGAGSPASHDGIEGTAAATKKERNEAYFAKLGSENASRSASLPPSQGGKFTGFGGGLPPAPANKGPARAGVPGLDDFQKDPVGALTKGFGWFTTAVGKSAKTVNDMYIQPTAKTIAESDFAAQARVQATQLGQNIQTGARGAAGHFSRFVEGPDEGAAAAARRRQEPERKDFWDDFSTLGEQDTPHRRNTSRSSAIGTTAIRPGGQGGSAAGVGSGSGPGSGGGAATGTGAAGGKKGHDEGGWDDNW
ncbi:GTPase-activating protein GCS1 [Aspergillus clavatus NRRL 1]|uniref:Zinc finger protein gcs1 n=1 Tax=Aspergillus clavatus (strain ATCC 1007 / CBS 513.65 / DSM 816 / NCTC 3887 / NRRL 1 / QM 1276 / 107) TaxID=344612 RepID=A1CA45_ASPCL|nr:zinc finger protein gcs1 [Aspergillus clavatus NRRL 1]EAW12613.1 zinc finger protein gcs1 [Aspergillus clavatus NRRL 1]